MPRNTDLDFTSQHRLFTVSEPSSRDMAQQGPPPVRVGVGVLVFRDRKDPHFVLGKRIGSLGAGSWSLPGGHLENGETFAECAARETKEETGLEIEDVRYLTAVETSWPSGQHYVTIFMAGVLGNVGAEPKVSGL